MTTEVMDVITVNLMREWVGLTEGERFQIYAELCGKSDYAIESDYASAIEAKLKERNT